MTETFFESVGVPDRILYSVPGGVNLVHQIGERIDGGFLNQLTLVHFLRKFSTTGGAENPKVLVVLTHHARSHWVSIAGKLGQNIPSLEEKGSLVIIDLLKEAYEATKGRTSGDAIESLFKVENIVKRCERVIQDFKATGSRRILVVLEDLTNLLDLDGPFEDAERQVINLLFRLRAVTYESYEGERCSVTITSLVKSPELANNSIELTRFAKTVSNSVATVVFEVAPLSTGFSAQVTGFLRVKYAPRTDSGSEAHSQFIKNYHFKLDNNSVRATPI